MDTEGELIDDLIDFFSFTEISLAICVNTVNSIAFLHLSIAFADRRY